MDHTPVIQELRPSLRSLSPRLSVWPLGLHLGPELRLQSLVCGAVGCGGRGEAWRGDCKCHLIFLAPASGGRSLLPIRQITCQSTSCSSIPPYAFPSHFSVPEIRLVCESSWRCGFPPQWCVEKRCILEPSTYGIS